MAKYPLDLLARANPVRHTPAVESPERLRQLIEATGPEAPVSRRGSSWGRPRVLQAMGATALAGAAVALGLVLTNSSSNTHLSVVASAYAALSPEDGIIEASFVVRYGHKGARFHEREWIEARTGENRIRSEEGRTATETSVSDSGVENWTSSSAGKQDVVHRWLTSRFAGRGGAVSALEAYRKLYLDKTIKLVGQVSWHGRPVWKLEGPGAGSQEPGGPSVPIETVVVLVDQTTYLPVLRQRISLIRPTHPIESETELLRYKRLPINPETEALLKVAPQHPDARIETRHGS